MTETDPNVISNLYDARIKEHFIGDINTSINKIDESQPSQVNTNGSISLASSRKFYLYKSIEF